MKAYLDALWRAVAYCWFPRVIGLSFAPLLLSMVVIGLLGYFYWEQGVGYTQHVLDNTTIFQWIQSGLSWLGWQDIRGVLAPLIVVAIAVPLTIIFCLLVVSQMLVPELSRLVQQRRFPQLQAQGSGLWVWSALRALGWTILALLILLISSPLWLIPPFSVIIPPVIWGWLSYRLMTADVLASWASKAEYKKLLQEHRWQLWSLGIIAGYLGAAPTMLWVFGLGTLVFAPLLLVASVWIYTAVFIFSALWFAHYALAALAQLRQATQSVTSQPVTELVEPGATLPAGAYQLAPPSLSLPAASDVKASL